MAFVFKNPANLSQQVSVGRLDDPAIPPGWLFCNSDGSVQRDLQQYVPSASGGWPKYGDSRDYASNPQVRVP